MTDSPHIGRPIADHCEHSTPPCEACQRNRAQQRKWNHAGELRPTEDIDGTPYYTDGPF